MKVVVACDSFKGCLKSEEVAYHVEQGIHRFDDTIDVISYAIGDGGEGSAEAFRSRYRQVPIHSAVPSLNR